MWYFIHPFCSALTIMTIMAFLQISAWGGENPDAISSLYEAARSGEDKQTETFLSKAMPTIKIGETEGELNALRVLDVLQGISTPAARETQNKLISALETSRLQSQRIPILRARLLAAEGKSAPALRALNDILSKQPGAWISAEASFSYAEMLTDAAQYDEAKSILAQSAQFWRAFEYRTGYNGLLNDKEYDRLRKRIHDADTSARAINEAYQKAESHRRQGNWKAAEERYQWIVKAAPKGAYGIPCIWRAYQCAAYGGNDEVALPSMVGFTELEIKQHAPLISLITGEVALFIHFNLDDAEKHFRAILISLKVLQETPKKGLKVMVVSSMPVGTFSPYLPSLIDRCALCRMLNRDFQTAEALLQQELAIRPPGRSAEGFNAADELLAMCHEQRLPVILPEVVMKGDQRTQLQLFFGAYQLYAGKHAESKRSFQSVLTDIKSKPSNEQKVYAQYELAELTRLEEKSDDATKAWDTIAAKNPKSVYAPYCLADAAKLCSAKGDEAGAIERLEKIAVQYPESLIGPSALYHLGFIHFFKDRYDAARSAFNLLCQRFPSSWEAQRVTAHELQTMPKSKEK